MESVVVVIKFIVAGEDALGDQREESGGKLERLLLDDGGLPHLLFISSGVSSEATYM